MKTVKIRDKNVILFSIPVSLSDIAYQRLRAEIKDKIGDNPVIILEEGLTLDSIIEKGDSDD